MRINLLPKEERGRSKSRVDWMRMGWFGAAVLAFVAVAFTVYNVIGLDLLAVEEADLFARVSALRVEQRAVSRQRVENDELEDRLASLEMSVFTDENARSVALLVDSARAVPADAWLDFLTVQAGRSLYASGWAAETEDLSSLLRNLRAMVRVDDVQLETMERVGAEGGFRREFSVRVTMGEETP